MLSIQQKNAQAIAHAAGQSGPVPQQQQQQDDGDDKDLVKQGQRVTRGHAVTNTAAATAGHPTQASGVTGKSAGVVPGRRKVAERPGMPVESSNAMEARMTSDRMLVFPLRGHTVMKAELTISIGFVPLVRELSSSKCSAPEPLVAIVSTNVRTKADRVANPGTKISTPLIGARI